MKAWRDRTGGVAQRPKKGAKKPSKKQLARQREAREIASLPEGLVSTVRSRVAAFEAAGNKGDGARKAMERAVEQTVAKVQKLRRQGKHAAAAATVRGFCEHRAIRPYLSVAEISTERSLAEKLVKNVGDLIKHQAQGGGRGNRSKQAAAGTHAVLTAITDEISPKKRAGGKGRQRTPTTETSGALPVGKVARLLQMPGSSGSRQLTAARATRRALTSSEETAYWVDLKVRAHRAGRLSAITSKACWMRLRRRKYAPLARSALPFTNGTHACENRDHSLCARPEPSLCGAMYCVRLGARCTVGRVLQMIR